MIYWITSGFLLIGALFEVFKSKWGEVALSGRSHKIILVAIIVYLILMAGLRYECGLDYIGYEGNYYALRSGIKPVINDSIELGFSIWARIMPTFRIFLITVAMFNVIGKAKFFVSVDARFLFTSLFFYFTTFFITYDMGLIRQGMAVAICIHSIKYIEKKSWKFFVMIGIACFFHLSALFFMPMFFIGSKEYSWRTYAAVLIGCFLLSFFASSANTVPDFMVNLTSFIGAKVTWYQNRSFTAATSLIRREVFAFFFLFLYKRTGIRLGGLFFQKRRSDPKIWLCVNAYILSIVELILPSLFGLGDIGTRGSVYAYIMYIPLYVYILKDTGFKFMNYIYFIAFVILSFGTMYFGMIYGSGNLLPYRSVFSTG